MYDVGGGNSPTGGIVSGSIVDGEGVSGISPSKGVVTSIDILMDKSKGVAMVVSNRLIIGGAVLVSGEMEGAIVIDIDMLTSPSILITGPSPNSGPAPNPGSTSLQLA